jgi:protein-tyrosine sulfotransferase
MTKIDNEGRRLIFIGGSPRSGTTLVQNMLDSHPSILGGPEFLHLPDIVELRRKLHASIDREWIDIFCSKEDVDHYAVKLIKRLFLSLADKHHRQFYSEKTPENILVFSELIELFPEANFIQVIRDPRSILSSMQLVRKRAIEKNIKPPYFTANTTASIAYIKKCFDAGFQASNYAPEKVLTVVYEQLLENPEDETKRICNHLGVEWDQLMLRPGDKEHLGNQAITIKSNEIWYDSKSYNRNLSAPDLEKWKNELSPGQQLKITLTFAGQKELMQYGYDFSLRRLMHGQRTLPRTSLGCLFLGRVICRSALFLVKKIPGMSSVRNRFSPMTGFFRLKS